MQNFLGIVVPNTKTGVGTGCSSGECLSSTCTCCCGCLLQIIEIHSLDGTLIPSTDYSYTSTGITALTDLSEYKLRTTFTTFED